MRLWDRDWRGVDSWPVLQRAKMRPTTRWIKKTKTNANKIPSTKHIFDQQRQQQWWQWQQSTNGNNASKNISSSSSNDKDLYICASDNSYKVRVLLDTLERSVSCCSGPKFRMRRSEGTPTGSMSVWNDETQGKGTKVQVNKVVVSSYFLTYHLTGAMYAKFGSAVLFSLALFLALVSKITDHRVCQQTLCLVEYPLAVLHQNRAWIETKASHHRDISTVRVMDLIWIGAFGAMDEKTGILIMPFDAASESPILLAAVKKQNLDFGLPILFFCTNLKVTCSDTVIWTEKPTKKVQSQEF